MCTKEQETPERLYVVAKEQAHARDGNIHAPMTVTMSADTGKRHKADSLPPRLFFFFQQHNTIMIGTIPITITAKETVRPVPMPVQGSGHIVQCLNKIQI